VFEAEVELRAGETTDLLARLPLGARIELELVGEYLAADDAAFEPTLRDTLFGEVPPAAEVFLVRPGRWPRPLVWEERFASTRFPLGEKRLSTPTLTGDLVLEARLPGGRVASTVVSLEDGRRTPVRLVFE
jgi:hypothetical protein